MMPQHVVGRRDVGTLRRGHTAAAWRSLAGLLVALLVTPSAAEPDLRTGQEAGPLTVYADDTRSRRFYYPPGDLALAETAEGKPDLYFLQMRYTGASATGDRGIIIRRNILSFGVKMAGPTAEEIRAAKKALKVAVGGRPELRPLPIGRLEAVLVYTPLGEAEGGAPTNDLSGGHFEGDADSGRTTRSAYWRERTYTMNLDDVTAQAFWDALQEGQVVLSVGYAFFADGIGPEQPLEELTGSPDLVSAMRKHLGWDEPQGEAEPGGETTDPDEEDPAGEHAGGAGCHVVRAGALAVALEAGKWPELFLRVDLNESAPPGYAVLEVRCYDFNNSLRPDLHEKQVEMDAEGVGEGRVRMMAVFEKSQPDLYAQTVRFPMAVRLDRPYRYRTIEVTLEGEEKAGPWVEQESWGRMLDVTSPASPNSVLGDDDDEDDDAAEGR